MTESTFNIVASMSAIPFIIAYALMIRRGVVDKSYGMPVFAICLNVSWESYFTFIAILPIAVKISNGFYLLFDLGVLYTCLRYGKEDFDWPIFKKYFYAFIALLLPACFILVYVFIKSFSDYGVLVTSFVVMIYSTLLVAMIIRRNNVKGQSLYIGIFIFVSDILGYVLALHVQSSVQMDVPRTWVHASWIYILLANIFYIALYYVVARRGGINPWKRL